MALWDTDTVHGCLTSPDSRPAPAGSTKSHACGAPPLLARARRRRYAALIHKSRTAVQPGTPVAALTARTIASDTTSAAIAPSAVSDSSAFDAPVDTASI